jgi:BirA family biotin operon repressor/biotin-[acetyl-CoA-carboxylase] ligase
LIAGVISQLAISKALNVSEIKLKWPNDLIYKNKKIGGILVEREISGSQNKTIVGIGINLALNEKEPWWGDLKSFNIQNSRDDILNNLIRGFFQFTDGDLVNWVELWNLHCAHKNKIIKIFNNKILIDEGIFAGINSKGALLLKSDKDLKEYNSGEILIEGIY